VNWQKQLEESIDYIEAHLTSSIDLEELGRITRSSAYHYQRVFAHIAGTTLAEYIRRRKMSLAGADLQDGDKVSDVSLKYGYESPSSFARAFKRIHGIAPTQAQVEGNTLKVYPRIRFKLTLTGDEEMQYRVENKEAFQILGLGMALEGDMESNFETVPGFWGQAFESGAIEKLMALANGEPQGLMGVTVGFEALVDDIAKAYQGEKVCKGASTKLRYYIAVASDAPAPEGFETYEVPALTWAIFSGSGIVDDKENAVQDLERRIFTEWLPSSGYEYAAGPDIELQTGGDPESTYMEFDIWVPIKKSA
jgi:AraC family transcriptional regulator